VLRAEAILRHQRANRYSERRLTGDGHGERLFPSIQRGDALLDRRTGIVCDVVDHPAPRIENGDVLTAIARQRGKGECEIRLAGLGDGLGVGRGFAHASGSGKRAVSRATAPRTISITRSPFSCAKAGDAVATTVVPNSAGTRRNSAASVASS